MRPSTNNRPRPRRRGFPYRLALAAIRPELARQLVEPVEGDAVQKPAHTKPPMPGTALAKERNR